MAPFFDTTVLIAGIIDFGKAAEPAQRILSAIASRRIRRPRTAWHCCLEFYAVVTRLPEEFRLLPEEAVRSATHGVTCWPWGRPRRWSTSTPAISHMEPD